MSKRVLILTSEPPERPGGVEHLVRELVMGLETKGYETEVFHRGNSEPAWLTKQTGRFGKKLSGTLCGYWVGRNAKKNVTNDVAAIISNSDMGFYPLRHQGFLKMIHYYHGTYRGQSEAIRPFISRSGYLYLKWWNSMVLERLSGRGKLILACSDLVREEVARFFDYESITMWYPLNTNHFRPRDTLASRHILGLPKEKTIGLFVGNSQPTKGIPVVRSLIKALPQVHWVLAIRGDLPESLADSNLTTLQDVSHERMPLLYDAADFSLCPSLYESFGYVVAEALACGTPVIASPGGASRFFLREPPMDRLLVRKEEAVKGFLDAVHEVLRRPELYRRLVIEHVRPKLEGLMAPENWWRRFFEVTGL